MSTAPGFRCLELDKTSASATKPLRDILETQTGFHSIYTHGSVVASFPRGGGSSQALRKLFEEVLGKEYLAIVPEQIDSAWRPPSGKLLWLQPSPQPSYCQNLTDLLGKLRDAVNAERLFAHKRGFLIAPALGFGLQSKHRMPMSLLDCHEYVVWDDGGLWNARSLKDNGAWVGAGWMRRRLAALQPSEVGHALTAISAWAHDARHNLSAYDDAWIQYVRGPNERQPLPDPPEWQQWNSYAQTLCSFLPFHKPMDDIDANEWLPSNGLADEGGPIVWRGYADKRMHMHLRHLFLDGWLTLWPTADDRLLLQPGSLAILYWAARWADMPHTGSPEAFLRGYRWDRRQEWFGGRWGKDYR